MIDLSFPEGKVFLKPKVPSLFIALNAKQSRHNELSSCVFCFGLFSGQRSIQQFQEIQSFTYPNTRRSNAAYHGMISAPSLTNSKMPSKKSKVEVFGITLYFGFQLLNNVSSLILVSSFPSFLLYPFFICICSNQFSCNF